MKKKTITQWQANKMKRFIAYVIENTTNGFCESLSQGAEAFFDAEGVDVDALFDAKCPHGKIVLTKDELRRICRRTLDRQ